MSDNNDRGDRPMSPPSMSPPRLKLVGKHEPEAVEAVGGEAMPPRAGADEAAAPTADERVASLAAKDRREKLRIIEAVLFAAPEPLDEARIATHLVEGTEIAPLLAELQQTYAERGINLVRVAGKWAFRTAEDLSFLLQRYALDERRLSKAALETLAIIAYHQPVTRAEIEEIRGVTTSAGTIDILLDTGWIRPRGRRRAPGRPVTYGTTENFLTHFGLEAIRDLPGLAELKGSGLLDANLPPGFAVPEPTDVAALMPDELPLEALEEEETQGEFSLEEADSDDAAEETASEHEHVQPDGSNAGDDAPSGRIDDGSEDRA
ncbi:MAG: SMC-Scp complex subunit ScpB [Hyphomicrobiaceae bacterium]